MFPSVTIFSTWRNIKSASKCHDLLAPCARFAFNTMVSGTRVCHRTMSSYPGIFVPRVLARILCNLSAKTRNPAWTDGPNVINDMASALLQSPKQITRWLLIWLLLAHSQIQRTVILLHSVICIVEQLYLNASIIHLTRLMFICRFYAECRCSTFVMLNLETATHFGWKFI